MLTIAGGIILAVVLIVLSPFLIAGAALLLYLGITHWMYSAALLVVVVLYARYKAPKQPPESSADS